MSNQASSHAAHTTLIEAQEVTALGDQALVLDVRHQLGDAHWGYANFLQGHIPGAHFLGMDTDLVGQKTGTNGRHPLPDYAQFVDTLYDLGLRPRRQVVALDQNNGMMAARLWWMLKHWLGHPETAVLNGGWQAWQASNLPVQSGAEHKASTQASGAAATLQAPPAAFNPNSSQEQGSSVDTEWILQNIVQATNTAYMLIDARAYDRYIGKTEPIDPVAGHIPKAINRPTTDNLGSDGKFKPTTQLRTEWQALLGNTPAERIVMQCGSGITACHNLLALETAGLGSAKLYVGSWSAWCTNPNLPRAV